MNRITSKVSRLATSVVGCLLLMSANVVVAASVLDQSNGAGQSLIGVASTDNWQQGVTAGVNGTLSSVSLYSYGGPTTFKVYINLGSPWQSDANAFEVQVTRPWGFEWFSIDVSVANIQLTNGARYVIGAEGASLLWGNDNTYSGGALWGKFGSGQPGSGPYGDLAFATYMTPIPEPSTLALSIIGLAMVVAAHRWRIICASRDFAAREIEPAGAAEPTASRRGCNRRIAAFLLISAALVIIPENMLLYLPWLRKEAQHDA